MNWLRTFGLGRLPADAFALMSAEDLVLRLEHLWSSVTFRDFSCGAGYAAWRRKWFAGSLAIGTERIVAYWGSSRLMNIPFSDARFQALDLSQSDERTIDISHDASLYHPAWRGRLQYRFNSEDARRVVSELQRWIS